MSNIIMRRVGLVDESDAAITDSNPLPVAVVSNTAGTAVERFNEVSAPGLASGASVNHDYTATGGTFIPSKFWASASGLLKMDVFVDIGAGLVQIFTGFNSAQNPVVEFDPEEDILIPVTKVARIRITNREALAQSVYSTIEGAQL